MNIPVIDIHQHLNFINSTHDDLVKHQKEFGVVKTILLPSAGIKSKDKGLLAEVPGTQDAYNFCQSNKDFLFAVNEPIEEREKIEDYIAKGAKLIGEIKYQMGGDDEELYGYAEIARQHNVPILIHFEKELGVELKGFHKVLKKFPDVNFIGHAVLWWDKMASSTNFLMNNHNNLYGDVSANSGLRAMKSKYAAGFIEKFQDRILFGSDCPPNHPYENAPHCIGKELKTVLEDKLDHTVLEKIYYKNACKLLGIKI
jgi:predicted TIM-barrel fold metal-dependent hydrolase